MDEQKIFGELYNINIEEYENIDIDCVLFSVRVNNRLHCADLETVGALLKCTPQRLAEINGFGAGCFKEIYEYIDGEMLTRLMVKYEVGIVSQQSLKIYKVDNSYFE